MLANLRTAAGGPKFAKLLWLIEDLIYNDLLKGTGWGRKRGHFRERLEHCKTTAKVASETTFGWITYTSLVMRSWWRLLRAVCAYLPRFDTLTCRR